VDNSYEWEAQMGKNNRQRREEKHRRRDRRRSEAPRERFGPGRASFRVDETPTEILVRSAALAMAGGDTMHLPGLLGQVTVRPDARRCTAQAIDEAKGMLEDRSWEPRLVANVVRRRLTVRHAKVVLEGLAGPEDVVPGIELLSVLLGLPPLPPLPKTTPINEVDAKILAKVRGLLAKAESTTYPEEAEALSAKAQELMARYAIDHALATAGVRPEAPGGRHLPLEDPYADAKTVILAAVARPNRCRTVHIADLALATVLGFESDLVAVELLFTSLLVQASRAMLAAGRTDPRSRQRGFRSSFLVAYGTRIGQRLEASTAAEVADADADHGGRLLPVLAARTEAVDGAVDAMFGDGLVSKSTRISDRRGWVAGHAAADLANLSVGPEIRAAG